MAFSWVSPGRTEEAGCNEAPYLVADGGIRRVTCGQLGRNNESFLFLSLCLPKLFPVRMEAHQAEFSEGGGVGGPI